MALTQVKVQEIVARCVAHHWGVPEFQRGFVWTPSKVRDLMDSLFAGFPIGTLLLWKSDSPVEPQSGQDAHAPEAWLVDGQQRTTALCLLFGRKPYWWSDAYEWNQALKDFDVRFSPSQHQEPLFVLTSAVTRDDRRWVRVRDVLNAVDEELSALASSYLQQNSLGLEGFGATFSRLDRVRKVGEIQLVAFEETRDLEDMVEIFARLNQAGTKVTEADVFLALAASRNPGWVRTEFRPFVAELEDQGFNLEPNLLFRSLIAIGAGKARFKEVADSFWDNEAKLTWRQAVDAWKRGIAALGEYGILSADILPTKNALLPLVLIIHKFKGGFRSDRAFAWFLHATRSRRYSGSAITTLEEDFALIENQASFDGAIEALRAKLEQWRPFQADDFWVDYRDPFLQLLLYLLAYSRGARDWGPGHPRLGFEGNQLLEGFNPDWHHIFPRAYLRSYGRSEKDLNLLANIAVVQQGTNIRIGRSEPARYIERYAIDDELLGQQLVPSDRGLFIADKYDDFLEERGRLLAGAANDFLARLSQG